jgi:hypothetical protein
METGFDLCRLEECAAGQGALVRVRTAAIAWAALYTVKTAGRSAIARGANKVDRGSRQNPKVSDSRRQVGQDGGQRHGGYPVGVVEMIFKR